MKLQQNVGSNGLSGEEEDADPALSKEIREAERLPQNTPFESHTVAAQSL